MPTQEEIRIFDAANKFNHILTPENNSKTEFHHSLYHLDSGKKSSSWVKNDLNQQTRDYSSNHQETNSHEVCTIELKKGK